MVHTSTWFHSFPGVITRGVVICASEELNRLVACWQYGLESIGFIYFICCLILIRCMLNYKRRGVGEKG